MSSVHVVMFPFPAQGHIPPMLKLAELLVSGAGPGLHVTFVNTEHVHVRLFRHSPVLDGLAQLPRFRFRTIPDGLPDNDPRPFHRLLDLEESMRTRSREAYRELLLCATDGRDCDGWPPASCVVADGILPLALEVAEEVGIPVMILRTSSACSLWAYCCIPQLIERGEVPFPEGADLDEEIPGIDGMEGILRRRDLPSLIRNAETANDRGIQFANIFSMNLTRARALILNTFESLESSVLSRIRTIVCPITYTLGPLHLLARSIASNSSNSSSVTLWPEDRACITWLDSQPHKSIVYISFGSSLIMSREEVLEFFYGLIDSGKRFLWVVRPDLIEGCVGSMPTELEEETKERGCFVSWAPQEEVLAHPAVGCFLTHSGWNSTMESMVAGVPMICRPFFVDQLINSRFASEVWKVGVDMKDMRGRDVVERMVREAMEGERADELRRSAREAEEATKRSAEEGGTSYVNLHKLIEHVKSMSSDITGLNKLA